MTFYGKDPEPKTSPGMKRFMYTTATTGPENAVSIKAQHVFFYESGHVGFWNDGEGDDRVLVLATKADDVWEDEE